MWGYTVHTGYHLLTSQDLPIVGTSDALIWHKQVPLKVSIMAWRLLHDRLLTKSNLLNRGILSPEVANCSTTCGQAETATHLLLHCTVVDGYVLVRCFRSGSSRSPGSFFSVHQLFRGLKACRSFLQLLWLLSVWLIWQ